MSENSLFTPCKHISIDKRTDNSLFTQYKYISIDKMSANSLFILRLIFLTLFAFDIFCKNLLPST